MKLEKYFCSVISLIAKSLECERTNRHSEREEKAEEAKGKI